MKEFSIRIQSFKDVQDFVALATVQPFRILVSGDQRLVNAKSFIGMVSLDFSRPLTVRCDCTQEEFASFRQQAGCFLAQ